MSLWARYILGDRDYMLDDIDVMWLAKSLWGECGKSGAEEDMLAVAFCMMQRWLRWPRGGQKWPFFHQFVRGFSQPVNPIWVNPSDYRRKQFPALCSQPRVNRRRKICNEPWIGIPHAPKRAALLFACGLASSPVPDAVNFGAKGLIRRQGKSGINLGGNVFIDASQDKDVKWTQGEIEIII